MGAIRFAPFLSRLTNHSLKSYIASSFYFIMHKFSLGVFMNNINPVIGFIGFGEVAYNFASGLLESGIKKIIAYDKAASQNSNIIKSRANELGVEIKTSINELVENSDIIISTVHGNVAYEVAKSASEFIKAGKLYVDINNTSPQTKLNIANVIGNTNAKFVDLELFETPARVKQKSYLLASGDGAKTFIDIMKNFEMTPNLVEGNPNKASEIKSLANIYMKGIQALTLELTVGAVNAGVDLKSIAPLIVKPVANIPAEKQLSFWILRGILHAGRKTAELDDINQALRDWNTEPVMMEATQKRLKQFAQFDISGFFGNDVSLDDCEKVVEKVRELSKEKGIEFK